jgi:hypothetical protein
VCELRDCGGVREARMLLEVAFEPVEVRDVEHAKEVLLRSGGGLLFGRAFAADPRGLAHPALLISRSSASSARAGSRSGEDDLGVIAQLIQDEANRVMVILVPELRRALFRAHG